MKPDYKSENLSFFGESTKVTDEPKTKRAGDLTSVDLRKRVQLAWNVGVIVGHVEGYLENITHSSTGVHIRVVQRIASYHENDQNLKLDKDDLIVFLN